MLISWKTLRFEFKISVKCDEKRNKKYGKIKRITDSENKKIKK